MKTILVANQKGGVGKSLIADEIAFSFERSGIPISFFDLDKQGGTIHSTHEDPKAKVQIVDTPGALDEDLPSWMREADGLVIPTRTTSRDIPTLQRMQEAAEKYCKGSVIYVLNGWNRYTASRDFLDWFMAEGGTKTIATLPQSEAFVQAGAADKSVVAVAKRSPAAQATKDLCNAVRSAAGFKKE